ncbi:hypothetical protein ADIS_1928 [Lunatimonas lonarensis]|uniref:Uncharacterized protein n=1 Tax=Lunatimonas lonarensis TaxID=1232681 RepID=R7ZUQ6_9BACT|nr:hypothetical protein ADIS_1928 [Lunatimonas lonarensis]
MLDLVNFAAFSPSLFDSFFWRSYYITDISLILYVQTLKPEIESIADFIV